MLTRLTLLLLSGIPSVCVGFVSKEYVGKYPANRIQLKNLPGKPTVGKRKPPLVVPEPNDAALTTHRGFKVALFAKDLHQPRWLQKTPEGYVLVTERALSKILILDWDENGRATSTETFADVSNGYNLAHGMEFIRINSTHSYFFLANTGEVLRFVYKIGSKKLIGRGTKIYDLPGEGYRQHWTRNVVAHPDGEHIFVSVGSLGNLGIEPLPRAAIIKMRINGSDDVIWGSGLRNPVGMDIHPVTQELYTTVNERDWLGDDLVPDYFTRVQKGEFFGWPFAYLSKDNLDPRVPRNLAISNRTIAPDVLIQAHSAALGLKFYDKQMFPSRYRNGAFLAFRGSWNRAKGTGYKIAFVPFHPRAHRPFPYYEDFVTGFLIDPNGPTVWGRPVGVLVLKDGSLLFTDEMGKRIYRVTYTRPRINVTDSLRVG